MISTAPARPNWKGYLKLSLVSCPVALYSATTTSERVRFNIINRKTGNRVHNQVVDAETGDPVEDDDRVKGYEVAKGEYVLVEDDELDEVALESTHTIDIEAFVPRKEVDEIYLDESYYIVPTDDKVADEAFAVIRDAMKKEDLVGLARVVLYRRERHPDAAAARQGPDGDRVALSQRGARRGRIFLRHPQREGAGRHARSRDPYPRRARSAHFDPDKFEDRYEDALTDLIKAKQRRQAAAEAARRRSPSNVINLMDALRRSVKADKGGGKANARAPHGAATAGSRRASARAPARATRRLKRRADMAELQTYRAKRDFGRHREPRGAAKARKKGIATSSRSTTRRGCTTTCGSSSTA